MCEVGDVTEADGKTKHTKLRVLTDPADGYTAISCEAAVAGMKGRGLAGFTRPKWGGCPRDAPIVYFGGPLRMELSFSGAEDEPPSFLQMRVTTEGVGEWSDVNYSLSIVERVKARPVVRIDYQDEQGKPVREEKELRWDI